MASDSLINPQSLIAKVKLLTNAQLKDVLKREGLPVSGVKSLLQERLIAPINDYASTGNYEAFNRMRALVNDPKGSLTPSPAASSRSIQTNTLPPLDPMFSLPNGHNRPPAQYAPKMNMQSFGSGMNALEFSDDFN
ncbi:MAG: hypothetical protein Q9191_001863 [Dirinaria sp. TL-2023a]